MANEIGPNLGTSAEISKAIIAAVERESADHERRHQLPARRVRASTGPTVVYSIRLDHAELAALDEQAADYGMKPSTLARNLVRAGLQARHNLILSDALDRLAQALDEVRSLVP